MAAAPILHLLCGRIASGKSTLAAKLAARDGAVLLAEDAWLAALYGDRMTEVEDFVRFSARLRAVVGPLVLSVLGRGVSVVLDFQANTVASRRWMMELVRSSGAAHRLHLLDVPSQVCLARLQARNAQGVHPFAVTTAQFERVNRHFAPPTADEGFAILRHAPPAGRGADTISGGS